MKRKRLIKRIAAAALAVVMTIPGGGISNPQENAAKAASTNASTQLTKAALANAYKNVTKTRRSVHDPSIIKKSDSEYYVYGSHMGTAKTSNLQNWEDTGIAGEDTEEAKQNYYGTRSSDGTVTNVSYEKAFEKGAYGKKEITIKNNKKVTVDFSSFPAGAWNTAKSDYTIRGNQWAPDIIYNKAMKKYCMYTSLNGAQWNSVVVLLTSDNINGPFVYEAPVVYSGFTESTTSAVSYQKTDLYLALNDGEAMTSLPKRYSGLIGSNSTYGTYWPHAIDPGVFYAEDGTLWMNYGSWSGGIYMLKLDPQTGLRDYTVDYKYEVNGNEVTDAVDTSAANANVTSDPYFGVKVAGGYYCSGEGSYIEKIGDYYFLFMSYGFYSPTGGYTMRIFRSENPDGPYVDANGNSAIYSKWVNDFKSGSRGTQLMGNYQWQNMDVAEVAQGHNSALLDDDGKAYLIYHTKFGDDTAAHELRVHSLYLNEDGWLVAAPYEYSGESETYDAGSKVTSYTASDVAGEYQILLHYYNNAKAADAGTIAENTDIAKPVTVTLNEDGTVSGEKTGTWKISANSSYITVSIDNREYKGVIVNQTIDGTDIKSLCFTALAKDGRCLWGSKVPTDKQAVAYTYNHNSIDGAVPSYTYVDLKLPAKSYYGAEITWKSSNESVIGSDGKIGTVPEGGADVTMTLTITKGNVYYTEDFKVTVKDAAGDAATGLESSYSFDGSLKDSVTGNTATACAQASGTKPAIEYNAERDGKVLHQYFGYDAAQSISYTQFTNPLKGKNIDGATVSLWVNRQDSDVWDAIWGFIDTDTTDTGKFYLTPNAYLGFNGQGEYFDCNHPDTGTTNAIASKEWHLVTVTVDKSDFGIYVDGALKYTSSEYSGFGSKDSHTYASMAENVLKTMTTSANFYLGYGSWWGSAPLLMDNLKIYSRSLTEADVAGLYKAELKELEKELPALTVATRGTAYVDTASEVTVTFTGTENVPDDADLYINDKKAAAGKKNSGDLATIKSLVKNGKTLTAVLSIPAFSGWHKQPGMDTLTVKNGNDKVLGTTTVGYDLSGVSADGGFRKIDTASNDYSTAYYKVSGTKVSFLTLIKGEKIHCDGVTAGGTTYGWWNGIASELYMTVGGKKYNVGSHVYQGKYANPITWNNDPALINASSAVRGFSAQGTFDDDTDLDQGCALLNTVDLSEIGYTEELMKGETFTMSGFIGPNDGGSAFAAVTENTVYELAKADKPDSSTDTRKASASVSGTAYLDTASDVKVTFTLSGSDIFNSRDAVYLNNTKITAKGDKVDKAVVKEITRSDTGIEVTLTLAAPEEWHKQTGTYTLSVKNMYNESLGSGSVSYAMDKLSPNTKYTPVQTASNQNTHAYYKIDGTKMYLLTLVQQTKIHSAGIAAGGTTYEWYNGIASEMYLTLDGTKYSIGSHVYNAQYANPIAWGAEDVSLIKDGSSVIRGYTAVGTFDDDSDTDTGCALLNIIDLADAGYTKSALSEKTFTFSGFVGPNDGGTAFAQVNDKAEYRFPKVVVPMAVATSGTAYIDQDSSVTVTFTSEETIPDGVKLYVNGKEAAAGAKNNGDLAVVKSIEKNGKVLKAVLAVPAFGGWHKQPGSDVLTVKDANGNELGTTTVGYDLTAVSSGSAYKKIATASNTHTTVYYKVDGTKVSFLTMVHTDKIHCDGATAGGTLYGWSNGINAEMYMTIDGVVYSVGSHVYHAVDGNEFANPIAWDDRTDYEKTLIKGAGVVRGFSAQGTFDDDTDTDNGCALLTVVDLADIGMTEADMAGKTFTMSGYAGPNDGGEAFTSVDADTTYLLKAVPAPVITPAPAATSSPVVTPTTEPAATPEEVSTTPVVTAEPVQTAEVTATPVLTEKPEASEEATATPEMTKAPVITEEPVQSVTPTKVPEATADATIEPTVTADVTIEPTADVTAVPTAKVTAQPTSVPQPTQTTIVDTKTGQTTTTIVEKKDGATIISKTVTDKNGKVLAEKKEEITESSTGTVRTIEISSSSNQKASVHIVTDASGNVKKETAVVDSGNVSVSKKTTVITVDAALAAQLKESGIRSTELRIGTDAVQTYITAKSKTIKVELPAKEDLQIGAVILTKESLLKLKKASRKANITVSTVTASGKEEQYTVSLTKSQLKKVKSNTKDVNITVNKTMISSLAGGSMKKNVNKVLSVNKLTGKKAYTVSFASNRGLKAGFVLQTANLAGNVKAGQKVYVYRYNAKTKKLETVANNKRTVAKDGTISLSVYAGKDYVVTTKQLKKGNVKTLLAGAKFSADTKKLSAKSKTKIHVEMSSDMMAVKKFGQSTEFGKEGVKVTYKSLNPSVAAVSANGTVKAKKKGTAKIRVTLQQKNGEKRTKTYSFKVTK